MRESIGHQWKWIHGQRVSNVGRICMPLRHHDNHWKPTLCEGNPQVTGNRESISMSWNHHDITSNVEMLRFSVIGGDFSLPFDAEGHEALKPSSPITECRVSGQRPCPDGTLRARQRLELPRPAACLSYITPTHRDARNWCCWWLGLFVQTFTKLTETYLADFTEKSRLICLLFCESPNDSP